VAIAALVAWPLGRAVGRAGLGGRAALAAWLALVWVGADGPSTFAWARENAALADADARASRVGLLLRATTGPDAVIAVVWAGAIPYFSRRPVVDLLGKSDPAIAKGAPATPAFFPGHNKWNYPYSLKTHHPDVIVDGYHLRPEDFALFKAEGFANMADGLFIRTDSRAVRQPELVSGWAEARR
jgi:hypothetical protein